MATGHWVCEVCNKPIDGDGHVRIFNINPDLGAVGGYPREPSPKYGSDEEPSEASVPPGVIPIIGAGEALRRAMAHRARRNIDFQAAHYACVPDPEDGMGPYSIDIKRDPTLENWVAWVLHLQEKNWMGREDLMRLLGFWWDHKRATQPTL